MSLCGFASLLGRNGVDAMVPLLDLLDHLRIGSSLSLLSLSLSLSSSYGVVSNCRHLKIEGGTRPGWCGGNDCRLPPDAVGGPPPPRRPEEGRRQRINTGGETLDERARCLDVCYRRYKDDCHNDSGVEVGDGGTVCPFSKQ